MFGIGTTELVLILAIILLVFGYKRVPALFQSLGQGVQYFKKGLKESDEPAKDVQPSDEQS